MPTPDSPRPIRRRALLKGAVGSTLLLTGATACGTGAEKPGGKQGADAENRAFPVTVEHKYGSTTIEESPRRVVTVGYTDQDALLALGLAPVGTMKWADGDLPGAIGEWARGHLGDSPLPEVLDDSAGVPFERVAALQPDLVLGLYAGLSQNDYDTLSRIAPTVVGTDHYPDYGIPWQDLTTTVGRAVGKPGEARGLVEDLEQRIADVRTKHPAFEGASAMVATTHDGYFLYGEVDPRTQFMQQVGFRYPDSARKLIGDRFGANLSAERTDVLDQDVVVWIVDDSGKGSAALDNDAVYQQRRVAREEREIRIQTGSPYGQAFSFASVLSLPFVLERLVPQLVAALDGDPGTRVEPRR